MTMQVVVPGHTTLSEVEEYINDAVYDHADLVEEVNFVSATPAETITNGQEEDSDIRC